MRCMQRTFGVPHNTIFQQILRPTLHADRVLRETEVIVMAAITTLKRGQWGRIAAGTTAESEQKSPVYIFIYILTSELRSNLTGSGQI
jgi:hypothetical protein